MTEISGNLTENSTGEAIADEFVWFRVRVAWWRTLLYWVGLVATLGLAFPWLQAMWYRDFLSKIRFGSIRLKFAGQGSGVFKIYIVNYLGSIFSLGIWYFTGYASRPVNTYLDSQIVRLVKGYTPTDDFVIFRARVNYKTRLKFWCGMLVSLGVAYPHLACMWCKDYVAKIRCGESRAKFTGSPSHFFRMYMLHYALTVLTCGLWWLFGPTSLLIDAYLDSKIESLEFGPLSSELAARTGGGGYLPTGGGRANEFSYSVLRPTPSAVLDLATTTSTDARQSKASQP